MSSLINFVATSLPPPPPPDSTGGSCLAELEMEPEEVQWGADEPVAAAAGVDVRGVRGHGGQAELGATRRCAGATEPGDSPLVQQQFDMRKHGVRQILECIRVGTPRLKRLLLCEVDIVYECQLCRSLFRGLPNLVVHRQFYCHPDDACTEDTNNNHRHHRDTLPKPARPQEKPVDLVVRPDPIASNHSAVYREAHAVAEPGRQGPSGAAPVDSTEAGPRPKTSPPLSPGYSCAACCKSFWLRRDWRRHVRAAHEKLDGEATGYSGTDAEDADRALCPVCRKSFSTIGNVRRHFRDAHRGVEWEVAGKASGSRPSPAPVNAPAPTRRLIEILEWMCPICKRKRGSLVAIKRHLRLCQKQNDFTTEETAGTTASVATTPPTTMAPTYLRDQRGKAYAKKTLLDNH